MGAAGRYSSLMGKFRIPFAFSTLVVMALFASGCGTSESLSNAEVPADVSTTSGSTETTSSGVKATTTLPIAAPVTVTAPPLPAPPPDESENVVCQVPQPTWSKIVGVNMDYRTQSGWPIEHFNLPSSGSLNVSVVPVDFPDANGDGASIDFAFQQIAQAAAYLESVSGAALTLNVSGVDNWVRLPETTTEYSQQYIGGPNPDLARDAIAAADPVHDFTNVSLMILVAPEGVSLPSEDGNPYYSTLGFATEMHMSAPLSAEGSVPNYLMTGPPYGKDWNQPWTFYVASLLVMVGLPELSRGSFDDVIGWPGGNGPSNMSGPFDQWSLMASPSGASKTLPAWSRWTMGWLSESEVFCTEVDEITSTFDLLLTPLDADTGGNKALMVRTGETTALVVESRRPIGIDSDLSAWKSLGREPEGLLVYTLDTTRSTRQGLLAPVLPEGREAVTLNGRGVLDALLGVGDSVVVAGLELSLMSSSDVDHLRVTPVGMSDAISASTSIYPLPAGQPIGFDLIAAPSEADEDVCRIQQLPGTHLEGQGYTGFPVIYGNLQPDQNVRLATIPVDWEDHQGDLTKLADKHEQVQIFMDYYETASQGALTFTPKFADKWYRLAEAVSDYPQRQVSDVNPKLAQHGIDAADDDLDFSQIDMVVFIFPNDAPIIAGVPPSPLEFASMQNFNEYPQNHENMVYSQEGWVRNYISGGMYFEHPVRPVWSYYVHEAAHLLAVPDWYMHEASAIFGSEQILDIDYSIGPLNVWGVMSSQDGPSRTFVAWTRWLLGWLNDNQVDCYTLEQIQQNGPFDSELVPLDIYESGTKAVIVQTGEYSGFLVESRRPVFPDRDIEIWETVGRDPYGLIVYEIDTTKPDGMGALSLVTPDGHDFKYIERHARTAPEVIDALFNVGDTATVQGIEIELLFTGGRDFVRLTPTD
jgi:M6 family metalloprotease-like protein